MNMVVSAEFTYSPESVLETFELYYMFILCKRTTLKASPIHTNDIYYHEFAFFTG